MQEKCEKCEHPRIWGERFCEQHKKIVMKEMLDSGYLKPAPYGFTGTNRTAEMRELTSETKNGIEHG